MRINWDDALEALDPELHPSWCYWHCSQWESRSLFLSVCIYTFWMTNICAHQNKFKQDVINVKGRSPCYPCSPHKKLSESTLLSNSSVFFSHPGVCMCIYVSERLRMYMCILFLYWGTSNSFLPVRERFGNTYFLWACRMCDYKPSFVFLARLLLQWVLECWQREQLFCFVSTNLCHQGYLLPSG